MAGRISSASRNPAMSRHAQDGGRYGSQSREPERPRAQHDIRRLTQEETDNAFFVDLGNVPREYECEWKRVSLLGADDPRNRAISERNGWKPAPRGNHPEIMGLSQDSTDDDKPIVINGLMLCYRPWDLSEEAHEERIARTRQTTDSFLAAIHGESRERMGRGGEKFVGYKRTYTPAPGAAPNPTTEMRE